MRWKSRVRKLLQRTYNLTNRGLDSSSVMMLGLNVRLQEKNASLRLRGTHRQLSTIRSLRYANSRMHLHTSWRPILLLGDALTTRKRGGIWPSPPCRVTVRLPTFVKNLNCHFRIWARYGCGEDATTMCTAITDNAASANGD
jgi:hypothetical protein